MGSRLVAKSSGLHPEDRGFESHLPNQELQDKLVARALAQACGCEQTLVEGYWWHGQTGEPRLLESPRRNIYDRYIGPDLYGAYTMLGTKRLDNLARLLKDLDDREVPGAVLEAGVWRGGALIWMAHHTKRLVFGADSFQGCPVPCWSEDTGNRYHELTFLKVPQYEVQANLRKFGVQRQVRLVPGWFVHTMPGLREKRWALLRIDCDMYEGTTQVLQSLYERLSPGGHVVIDDYGTVREVREAVDTFRGERQVSAPLRMTDHTEAVWEK